MRIINLCLKNCYAKIIIIIFLSLIVDYLFISQSQNRARPGHAKPVPKYFNLTLFLHDWASDRRCEALDSSNRNRFLSSIDLEGPLGRSIGLNGGL